MARQRKLFERRKNRVRYRIRRNATGRARLSVFRSSMHIYAQVIDDATRRTLASASSADAAKSGALSKTWNLEAATVVGKLIAERALANGVKQVVFDRGGYLYHGRVKALGDAAREGGLQF
ncbi:MAG: 50S ribosomal protein L18 [Micropepsaceae bacterium]